MKKVVVWRTDLLPSSETFVVNQLGALTRWEPVLAGNRRVAGMTGLAPALVLERAGAWARLNRILYWRTGIAPSLLALFRRRGTAVVHAHFGFDAVFILRSVRLARRPLVVTFHGYDATDDFADHPDSPLKEHWDELMAYATTVIAVSDYIAELIRARGIPAGKLVVRPIGIPIPPDCPGIDDGRPDQIVFVGRLMDRKGCADLLSAVARLPPDQRSTPVVVIGDGWERDRLADQARELGLGVTFRGVLGAEEVAAELRRSTIFCMPARREGFGMVFLEAAAARLPVVAYRTGGAVEAVKDGETGLLVEPGDVHALADALSGLLANRPWAESLGAAGRARVEVRFDIATCTVALEDEYDRATSRLRT